MMSCKALGRPAVAFAVTTAVIASGAAQAEDRYEERPTPEVRGQGEGPGPKAQQAVQPELVEGERRERAPSERGGGDRPDAIPGASELTRELVVGEVLRRNPTVAAAQAGWRAALARVPQERALDDPMFSYAIAPLSVFSRETRLGQSIELQQRIPIAGQRRLRGEVALAEASRARESWAETQHRLALAASLLYDDWYLAHRALEVNAEHIELVEALKKSAQALYVVGRASQQDPLQAEVELSHLLHDRVVLATQRDAVRAELNGLLHRPPQAKLPPPPKTLPAREQPPASSEDLQALALRQRPELAGTRADIEAQSAAIDLARRAYYPDIAVMGAYNSMWMETAHQYMIGISIEVPLYFGKRRAAVEEATASFSRAAHEQEQLEDEVRVEVEKARQRLVEAQHLLHLYRTRLVPAAKDQVAAARAGFETGRNPFLALIEAEKNLRSVELRAQAAVADVHRREAELQRAVGDVPGLQPKGGRP